LLVADTLEPETLLQAYAMGVFPMAEGREDSEIHWVDPRRRGIMPLDDFHISRSLARTLRQTPLIVTVDRDFDAVVSACAEREETWISHQIQILYSQLHRRGFAHSIEVRTSADAGNDLVGGVYGVTLGGAFFGESMFSRVTDASKIALAYTVHRLRAGGFTLFDTQFLTPHLASLGAVEIPRAAYHRRLADALARPASFDPPGYSPSASDVAASGSTQSRTQTS